jgi:di/tripeptidase
MKKLKKILSLPTAFGHEELIKNYLTLYGLKKDYKVQEDELGNIYFIKGELIEGEYYPLLCAHMDSVFDGCGGKDNHILLVDKRQRKIIQEEKIKGKKAYVAYHPQTKKRTGLAADDLAGIFVILEIMKKLEKVKVIFFVEEEFGAFGSEGVEEFFMEDVGYFLSLDAPTNNWYSKFLNGLRLFDDSFDEVVKPILENYNINNYSDDPMGDLFRLVSKFKLCGANLPVGYYEQHTNREYVILSEVKQAIKLGLALVKQLQNKRYLHGRL